jgi:hypothetical protein
VRRRPFWRTVGHFELLTGLGIGAVEDGDDLLIVLG